MKILIDCEESGKVREAFKELGHDAWSCDLLPSRIPGQHLQCDAIEALWSQEWDLVIAHPPCTFLANSGVRWLFSKKTGLNQDRYSKMLEATKFFKQFKLYGKLGNPISIENPIMHKYAKEEIWLESENPKPSQIIQPWQFGHGETKATCLWNFHLPNLKPTKIVEGREQIIWRMGPSEDRQRKRSETYQGIANAMAEQWSAYLD